MNQRLRMVFSLVLVCACRSAGPAPLQEHASSGSASARPSGLGILALPPPDTKGRTPFETVLGTRRSVRNFAAEPPSLAQLGQLAWAAQGLSDRASGARTAPSAGALYPLEVYFVRADGLLHYRPSEHTLERLTSSDLRRPLAQAALDQAVVGEAPCVVVLTAVTERTARKYGDRAPRFVAMEAGHAAQNLLLQAEALGLGAVPIGGFDDRAVARVLALPASEEPLYLVPVGRTVFGSDGG